VAEPKTSRAAGAPTKGEQKPVNKARQRLGKEAQPPNHETLVNELEERVDRLRAAYDQYFMGIEKLPPHVLLKEVERRLAELRKVQIRNTALRFKYQTTLQRYNTYQSYWQRICRQIEEGTYKRDLRRAQERFGPRARKPKEMAEYEIDIEFDEPMSDDDVAALLASDDDADTLPPAPGEGPAFEVLVPRDSGFTDSTRSLLGLDNQDDGIPYMAPRAPIEERPSQRHLSRAGPDSPPPPPPPQQQPAPQPKGLMFGQSAVRPLNPANPAAGRIIGAPRGPVGPHRIMLPAQRNAQPAAENPPPAQQPAPRRRSAPPPAGAPQQRPSRKSSRPPRRHEDLSDERVRQLYAQYIEARTRTQDASAALTYDTLAKSLRESSARLREKNAGKKVDFEVAEKDGKTVLRPVVKDK
jgi:hypothetical protein